MPTGHDLGISQRDIDKLGDAIGNARFDRAVELVGELRGRNSRVAPMPGTCGSVRTYIWEALEAYFSAELKWMGDYDYAGIREHLTKTNTRLNQASNRLRDTDDCLACADLIRLIQALVDTLEPALWIENAEVLSDPRTMRIQAEAALSSLTWLPNVADDASESASLDVLLRKELNARKFYFEALQAYATYLAATRGGMVTRVESGQTTASSPTGSSYHDAREFLSSRAARLSELSASEKEQHLRACLRFLKEQESASGRARLYVHGARVISSISWYKDLSRGKKDEATTLSILETLKEKLLADPAAQPFLEPAAVRTKNDTGTQPSGRDIYGESTLAFQSVDTGWRNAKLGWRRSNDGDLEWIDVNITLRLHTFNICTVEFEIDFDSDLFPEGIPARELRQVEFLPSPFAGVNAIVWHKLQNGVVEPVSYQDVRLAFTCIASEIKQHLDRLVADGVPQSLHETRRTPTRRSNGIPAASGALESAPCSKGTGEPASDSQDGNAAEGRTRFQDFSHFAWYTLVSSPRWELRGKYGSEDVTSFHGLLADNHPEFRGLILPPREPRATVDDWLLAEMPTRANLENRNLAPIRSHAGDLMLVGDCHAVLFYPDDPLYLIDQFAETVMHAAKIRCLVRSLNQEADKTLDEVQRRASGLRDLKKVEPSDLKMIRDLRVKISDFRERSFALLEQTSLLTIAPFQDHAEQTRRALEDMGVPRLRGSLDQKLEMMREDSATISATAELAFAEDRSNGEEDRSRREQVLTFFVIVLAAMAAIPLIDDLRFLLYFWFQGGDAERRETNLVQAIEEILAREEQFRSDAFIIGLVVIILFVRLALWAAPEAKNTLLDLIKSRGKDSGTRTGST